MRKSGDFNDDLEEAKAFFPRRSHKAVEQLVKRVQAMEAEKAGKNVKAALQALAGGTSSSTSMNWTLGRELGKALGQRGGHVESPSIRQKAAGGRPFHFAHSTVKKADVPRAATGGKGQLKLGKAAAHMRYIERELAVEATYGLSPEALGRDHQERDGGPAGDRPKDDRRWDRDSAYRAVGENSAAHQGYVENPVKLESGEVVTFSFGTIGETFAERVRFWEALEASEPHPSARVQERLIIELPHEAAPTPATA